MKKWTIGGFLVLFLAWDANAASVSLKDYNEPDNEQVREYNKAFLDGVMEGLLVSNEELKAEGKPPLFCLPPELAITPEQAKDIMLREAKKVPDPERFHISFFLMQGIIDTFPCATKKE